MELIYHILLLLGGGRRVLELWESSRRWLQLLIHIVVVHYLHGRWNELLRSLGLTSSRLLLQLLRRWRGVLLVDTRSTPGPLHSQLDLTGRYLLVWGRRRATLLTDWCIDLVLLRLWRLLGHHIVACSRLRDAVWGGGWWRWYSTSAKIEVVLMSGISELDWRWDGMHIGRLAQHGLHLLLLV